MSDIIEALVTAGALEASSAERVRSHAQATGTSLADAATSFGGVDAGLVFAVTAQARGYEATASLADEPVDPDAVVILTREQAQFWGVVPLRREGGALVVAASPKRANDSQIRENMALKAGMEVRWLLAREHEVAAKLDAVYRNDAKINELTERTATNRVEVGLEAAVKLVDLILEQAVRDRASDIHFDPRQNSMRVRYRIDGVLVDRQPIPKDLVAPVVSRVKILSDMDPANQRIAQDGRIGYERDGVSVDMRVATMPLVLGEKATIRLLDSKEDVAHIADLGMSTMNQALWDAAYNKAQGMLLVTGPMGSGKSSTLRVTAEELSTEERSIMTLENPVEYIIPGANQIQANTGGGLTFEDSLKGLLRHDADVLLIGEIRDEQTADVAAEAAELGRLVLSTMHTNSAPEAMLRLVGLGVKPVTAASIVDCVLAQRLVRRLCARCREPYEPTTEEVESSGFQLPEDTQAQFYRPGAGGSGCNRCTNGYKGRVAVHEAMVRTGELERLVARGDFSSREVYDMAIQQGMRPMRQDGWLKVAAGLTTITEVLRVVPEERA